MDRRRFLLGSGVGAVSFLGGCLTEGDSAEGDSETPDIHPPSGVDTNSELTTPNTTESEPTVEDAFPEPVDPTVIATHSTDPRLVSMEEQSVGSRSEFSVTVENTGIGGEIGVEFFWVKNLDEEWKGVENAGNRQKESERIVYFDAGERRDVSFVGDPPLGYEGYAFDLFAATFAADIRNDGGAGDVEVKLTNPDVMDAITARRTITLEEGATRRVEFTTEHPQLGSAFDIEADPVYDP